MIELIAGVIGLVSLILGVIFKRKKKLSPREKLLKTINKELKKRAKKEGKELALDDFERGERIDLLLRLQRDQDRTKQ